MGDPLDHGLEALLNLHGWTAEVGRGFWVSVMALRVAPDQGRPHGVSYPLTLHRPEGERILGYDNAHFPPIGSGPGQKFRRKRRGYDHLHRRSRIVWYDFDSASKLLEDFWNDVRSSLKEEGVPWME